MMRNKFWLSTALSIPLLILTMGGRHLISNESVHQFLPWIELTLATPVVLWGGWPFFVRFWESLKNRNLNMFTLIGLGVGVAEDLPSVLPQQRRVNRVVTAELRELGHEGLVELRYLPAGCRKRARVVEPDTV